MCLFVCLFVCCCFFVVVVFFCFFFVCVCYFCFFVCLFFVGFVFFGGGCLQNCTRKDEHFWISAAMYALMLVSLEKANTHNHSNT